jgi:light-regulated signal transduction histidine kinase (bacteriophytochrome)
MAALADQIEESGAVIKAAPLPVVCGDMEQMTVLFLNLLSNALKYRKKDVAPRIEVQAERLSGQWVISVRDNGIGFEQQYAKRIFGLFKRLHKEEYPGTGLGLAICQRIVARYGGRIWAEGSPNEGASFHFSLDAVDK